MYWNFYEINHWNKYWIQSGLFIIHKAQWYEWTWHMCLWLSHFFKLQFSLQYFTRPQDEQRRKLQRVPQLWQVSYKLWQWGEQYGLTHFLHLKRFPISGCLPHILQSFNLTSSSSIWDIPHEEQFSWSTAIQLWLQIYFEHDLHL